MIEKDKISVVVPIYNVEKYLERCINSIINQTYKNLEIILVDDGSTDNSGKIADKYKKIDSRIKVIHKTNGGLSDARNKGIRIASGKYISFIDSDDYIAEDMISYLYKLIKDNNSEISICNFQQFSSIEEINDSKDFNIDESNIYNYTGVEMLQILLKGNISYGDYAWNKLYLLSLFNNIQYPIGKKMEDIGTTYKLYFNSKKVTIGTEKKYFYYKRNDSILGKNDIKVYQDKLELSIERIEWLQKRNVKLDYTDYNIDLINKIIELYRNNNNIDSKKYFYEKKYDLLLDKLLKSIKIFNKVSLKQYMKIIITHAIIKFKKNN